MAQTARKTAQSSADQGKASKGTVAKAGKAKPVTAERISAEDVIAQAEANVAKLDPDMSDAEREARARRERFTAAVLLSTYPQSQLSGEARAFVIDNGQTAATVVTDAEATQAKVNEMFKAARTRAAEARALMGAYAFGVTSVSKLMTQTALAESWYPDDAESARKKKISNLVEAGRIAAKVGATPVQFGEISTLVNKAAEKVGSKETLKRLVAEATKYGELTAGVKRVQTERELEAAKGKGPNGQTVGQQRPQRDADEDVRAWLPNYAETMTQALVKASKAKLALSPAKDGATPTEALRNLRTAIDQYLTAIGETVSA